MPIETPTQNERHTLLERGRIYYGTLLDLAGPTDYVTDLERLVHSTGNRVYTLTFPNYDRHIDGELREGTTLVSFGTPRRSPPLMMTFGQTWTSLSGDAYFVGRKHGVPNYSPRLWEGENKHLREHPVEAPRDAFLSRIHLIVFKPDENRIVLADVGRNPINFYEREF